VLSTLSCFGFVLCDGLLPAIGFRAVAGITFAAARRCESALDFDLN